MVPPHSNNKQFADEVSRGVTINSKNQTASRISNFEEKLAFAEKFYQETNLEKLFQKERDNRRGDRLKISPTNVSFQIRILTRPPKLKRGKIPARYGLVQIIGTVRMNRPKIIPVLCDQLDQFSFDS